MEIQLIERIQRSIDFIEENLYERINLEDTAKAALMSLSSFYAVFSNILGTTVKDYIRKRRLSLSALELVDSNYTILDIALKYQYYSSEAYSRAFKKLYGLSPKDYRLRGLYIDIFPKITLNYINKTGGNVMINREMNKDVVINNINSSSNGFVLDIDIDHFDNINKNYGFEIGDKILIEVPNRIKAVLENYNIKTEVTRINNDEFAVIIKNESKELITKLSKDIIASAEPKFIFGETIVKLTLSIGISEFSFGSNNEEVIKNANEAMLNAKKNGRNQYSLSC